MIDKKEKLGNLLFKYRGQIPILFFLLSIPFLFYTNQISYQSQNIFNFFSVIFLIFGFLIRAYTIGTTPSGTSGRNTKYQVADELNTTGLYSILKHPLYLGNYFIWLGVVIFSYNILLVIIVSILYFIYYGIIIYAEDVFLSKKYKEKYLNWSKRIGSFIPNFSCFEKSKLSFSFKSVLRREYSGLLAAIISYNYIFVLRNYFHFEKIKFSFFLISCLIIILIISIFLKILKTKTKILDEKGRV